jgi:hypothetical protein
MLASELAALSEETADEQFLEQARSDFARALESPSPVEDPGLFGTLFRSAQYFPWFLSKESQSGNKRDVSVLSRP